MILLPWSPRKLPHTAESQSRSRWSSICNRWNLWAGADDQGPSRSRLNIYENQSTVNYDINHRWLQSLSYTHQMFCQRSNEGCQLPAFSAIPQLNKNCPTIKQGFKSNYVMLGNGIHAPICWQEVVVGQRGCWGSLHLQWYEAEKCCPSHHGIVQHSGWGWQRDSDSCYIPTWQ